MKKDKKLQSNNRNTAKKNNTSVGFEPTNKSFERQSNEHSFEVTDSCSNNAKDCK